MHVSKSGAASTEHRVSEVRAAARVVVLTHGVSRELSRHKAHASGEVVAAQGGPETVDSIG